MAERLSEPYRIRPSGGCPWVFGADFLEVLCREPLGDAHGAAWQELVSQGGHLEGLNWLTERRLTCATLAIGVGPEDYRWLM